MQRTSDRNKEAAANPNAADQRQKDGTAGSATELGRHYGEHGHPATASAGPSAHDSAHEAAGGIEAARDMANRVREQAAPAIAKITETAQDFANRAREQAGPAAQAVYDQGARAGQYVTRNVHEYPATALLIAAAVGYGLAYLLHGGSSRREVHNRYDQGAH